MTTITVATMDKEFSGSLSDASLFQHASDLIRLDHRRVRQRTFHPSLQVTFAVLTAAAVAKTRGCTVNQVASLIGRSQPQQRDALSIRMRRAYDDGFLCRYRVGEGLVYMINNAENRAFCEAELEKRRMSATTSATVRVDRSEYEELRKLRDLLSATDIEATLKQTAANALV